MQRLCVKEVISVNENCDQICLCPLEGVIDIISKKWALLIVNAIGNNGTLRFNSLIEQLRGISPRTLSDTLKGLQALRLIKRKSFAEIPPRVEYSLTEDGKEFRNSIIPLLRWAATRNTTEKRCGSMYRGIPAHKLKKTSSPNYQP